jgi:hypothetical protein
MNVSYDVSFKKIMVKEAVFHIRDDEVFYDSVVRAVGIARTLPTKFVRIIFGGRVKRFELSKSLETICEADIICQTWNRSKPIRKA